MTKSNFIEDKRKEELFGEWLDEHFYKFWESSYKNIERVKDVNLQKQGIDVIITTNDDRIIYVDEKATLNYINKDLSTFAFEIKNRDNNAKGWLFNYNYKTDDYMLAWPKASDTEIRSAKSFIGSEIMCIERKQVLKLLEDNHLSEYEIERYVLKYEAIHKKNPSQQKFPISKGIALYFNTSLKELPLNLVINKQLLKRYAKYHIFIE